MATHLALVRAEYAYEAQTDDELTLIEDAAYYLLSTEDPEWHKVKLKTSPTSDEATPSGLVPANYLIPAPVIRKVTAMYGYEAQTEDEMTIAEDEALDLMEEDGEWSLVSRPDLGVGYVPTAYVEAAGTAEAAPEEEDEDEEQEEEVEEETTAEPVAPAAPVITGSARDVKTWSVTDLDGKKKRKGTLGVGNGALFFASGSDKTGVQQYRLTEVTSVKTEKGKRILIVCGAEELHFQVPTKEIDAIVAKIEEGRHPSAAESSSPPAAPPPPPSTVVVPPAPPPPTSAAILPPPQRGADPVVRPPSALATGGGSSNGRKVSFASSPAGRPAVALYDFEAQGDDELTVSEGEKLFVLDSESDDDWWKCRKDPTGEEGVVPASYVELDQGAPSGNAAAAESAAAAAAAAAAKRDRMREEEDARLAAQRAEEGDEDEDARRQGVEEAERKVAKAREAEGRKKGEADAAAKRKREAEYRAAQMREAERALRTVPGIPSSGPPPPRVAARPDSAQSISRPTASSAGDAPVPPRRPDSAPREGKSKPQGKVRTWRDKTGQFKVEASFLGLSNGKIRLHKLNGVIIDVPLGKMSKDDVAWLEGATGRSLRPGGHGADEGDGVGDRRRREKGGQPTLPSAAAAERTRQQSMPAPKRKQIDWFDFFLNAGCDLDDCTRYARNFDGDKIDESVLPDLEPATLRNLGLREGDVIRVRKLIKQKYGGAKKGDEDQIRKDEEMARRLASGEDQAPGGIFTSGPNGALKTTRRGRPDRSRSNTLNAVDAASITSARDQLISTSPVPSTPPVPPPKLGAGVGEEGKRSSSTVPLAGGFDDDAWTVRPTSKPTTPNPQTPAPPSAPAPAPAAPPAPPAPTPAAAAPAASLSDQIMDKIMTAGQNRQQVPPQSQPSPAPQQGQQYQSPIPTGYQPPSGARGPLAPVASNAPMLNPLIPTQTGMTGWVPTRQRPQQTGFLGPQPTGMQSPPPQGMGMQPTGMGMQPTGMGMGMGIGMGMGMQQQGMMGPQPTGMMQMSMPPTNMGMVQPQQTGYMPQNFSSSIGPPAMYSQPPPLPPQLSASVPAGGASTPGKSFEPGNIFAQMKTGAFGGSTSSAPQDAGRYDALRPAMTGMPPQQTGFGSFGQQMMPGGGPPPGQAPIASQPTGFAQGGYIGQQPPGVYPQQTGWRGY